jgi:hypothetical protein
LEKGSRDCSRDHSIDFWSLSKIKSDFLKRKGRKEEKHYKASWFYGI